MINEHKKGVKAMKYTAKTKNPVAKAHQTIGTGSGPHKDKKKAAKQGDVKHKKAAMSMAEDSPLDRVKNKLGAQGYISTPDEKLRDRERWEKERDHAHQSSMTRRDADDDYYKAQLQHEIDVLNHRLKRMDRDDDDWETTFDMMRDRLNRYQYATQRDVDPEQLDKISNIKYQPTKKTDEASLDQIRKQSQQKAMANKQAWDKTSPEEKKRAMQLGQLGRKGMKESEKKTLRNSNPCWKGYHPVGTKKKGGKTVPNCVPTNESRITAYDLKLARMLNEAKKSVKK